ncbi:MAG TPA: GNAT family N-acetyltransferase [Actinocrinis sp.]
MEKYVIMHDVAPPAVGRQIRRIDDYQELLDAIGSDAFVRMEVMRDEPLNAWVTQSAYAVVSRDLEGDEGFAWLSAIGEPEEAARLVDIVLSEARDADGTITQPVGFTVPRALDVARWGGTVGEFSTWDVMVTESAPPAQPGEDAVRPLSDQSELSEIQAFLDAHSPRHSVAADKPSVQLWGGIRDEHDGTLLSIGALTLRGDRVPYLASIATVPHARGRGYGAAVTAFLTRVALASGSPLCTLAHYHPNPAARSVYQRVGFRTTHQNVSSLLPR